MTLHRRTLLKQLGLSTVGLGMTSFLPRYLSAGEAGMLDGLPRSTPGAQRMPPEALLQFLAAIHKAGQGVHSLMMVRHGYVIAEGWWSPYRSEAVHLLNSLSKCFTSTAVGFAVAEGKLSIEDRVVQFFPDDLPAKVSDHLAALRVKDLLTMSIGHASDSTPVIRKEDNWAKTFLSLPIEHAPGNVFLYDSGGTYMLSAILQRLSGQKLIDYLQPRFFAPLAIRAVTWETCPRGINTGGWGMSATTEALAKLGQFYLQRGRWNGTQLLPAAWVDAATSMQISTAAFGTTKTPEWGQGYGYQFWRCRHNVFRGDGAGGQLCIVFPEQDAVVAMTSSTDDIQGLLDLVWEHLLPALRAEDRGRDSAAEAQLRSQLTSLALPLPSGSATSPIARAISGKTYTLDPNTIQASSVSIEFADKSYLLRVKNANGLSELRCGFGRWIASMTTMFGPKPVEVSAAGAWKNDNTLELRWCTHMGHNSFVLRFDGDALSISLPASSAPNSETKPLFTGRLSA